MQSHQKQAHSEQITSTGGYGHFSCEEFGFGEKKVEPAPLELSEPVTQEDMVEIRQEFEDIMAEFSSNVVQVTRRTEEEVRPEPVEVTVLKKLEPMPEVEECEDHRSAGPILPPQPGYKPAPAAEDNDDFETYTRIR